MPLKLVLLLLLLAPHAFVRTNRRAIAILFVLPSIHIRLPVWDGRVL